MNFSKRLILALGLSLAFVSAANAITIAEAHENPGLSMVYIRWTETNNPASARYSVTRQAYNSAGEPKGSPVTLVSDLCRLQYIDTGVLPGNYVYTVTSSTSGATTTSKISVSDRDHNKNIYSLDVVYETTPDELMAQWKAMGNVDWDDFSSGSDGSVTGMFLHTSNPNWVGNTAFDNSTRSLSQHSYKADYFSQVPNVKKNGIPGKNNGQVLDGNRYIWLDQMDNFSERSSDGSACYPWAGRGMSWRGSNWTKPDNPAETGNSFKQGERCWYIPIREKATDEVHGILCVWDPDRSTSTLPGDRELPDVDGRPYHGAPLYLNLKLAREIDLDVPYKNNDQFFSLAFSDNGRSYILRQGNTGFDTKPADKQESYWIYPTNIKGSSHVWRPVKKDYSGMFDQEGQLPGNPCNLINVKGNMHYTSNDPGRYAPTDYNKWKHAFLYMLPTYSAKKDNTYNTYNGVKVRREKIANNAYVGYTRFDIDGLPTISNADINYVIPVAGSDRNGFLVQLKNNYMVYVYDTFAANAKIGKAEEGKQNVVVNSDNYKVINLGEDFTQNVGGCSFVYKGETFLVLPAARYDGKNYGDFTVFKIEGRDANFTLVPIIDYKVKKDVYNANVKRSFFDAEVYEQDGFVWICRYLPGRRLDKYKLYMPPVHDAQPVVEHSLQYGNLLPDKSYRQNKFGDGSELKDLNKNYTRLTALNTNFRWDNGSYPVWNNSTAYETVWMLDGVDARAYYANNAGSDHGGYRELHNTYHTDGISNVSNPWGNTNYGHNHEFSIHVQPVLVRRHNGFTERVVGKYGYANNQMSYTPNSPGLSVKVMKGWNYETDQESGDYRVDLYLTKPTPTHAYDKYNKDLGEVPVDYYTFSYNGKTIDDFNTVIGDQNQYFLDLSVGEKKNPALKYAGNKNINFLTHQHTVWGDYNFSAWPAPVLEPGESRINKNAATISFYTKDKTVADRNTVFKVTAHYAPGAHTEFYKTTEATASPTDFITTGIDNITVDNQQWEEWFTVSGIRVNPAKLAPGVYIRRTAAGATKVLVR